MNNIFRQMFIIYIIFLHLKSVRSQNIKTLNPLQNNKQFMLKTCLFQSTNQNKDAFQWDAHRPRQ